jgi:hypothetical protein
MSEYRRQIVAGAVMAVVIALVLAGGASYLFPPQHPQTTSTIFLIPTKAATTSTTTAAGIATFPTTTTMRSTTTSTETYTSSFGGQNITTYTTTSRSTILPPPITTVIGNASSAPTNITVISITGTAIGPTVTVTVTQSLIKDVEVTGVYYNASIPTHVFVSVKNAGSMDQTITDILVNGMPLTSVNGGTSNPILPMTIAAGSSETITLTFSAPLSPGTYFVTIRTG